MHKLNQLSNPVERIKVKMDLAHQDKVKQAKLVLTILQSLIIVVSYFALLIVSATPLKEFNVVPFFATLIIVGKIQMMKGEL